MEKFAEVLLKLESKDAITIANKYIMFKYFEQGIILAAVGIILTVVYFGIRMMVRES